MRAGPRGWVLRVPFLLYQMALIRERHLEYRPLGVVLLPVDLAAFVHVRSCEILQRWW